MFRAVTDIGTTNWVVPMRLHPLRFAPSLARAQVIKSSISVVTFFGSNLWQGVLFTGTMSAALLQQQVLSARTCGIGARPAARGRTSLVVRAGEPSWKLVSPIADKRSSLYYLSKLLIMASHTRFHDPDPGSHAFGANSRMVSMLVIFLNKWPYF